MQFPKNFVWGAAAASYQIEGAASEDGKGLSIWDVFSHQPGKVYNNDNGDVSCDHYHRYTEDVALMKSIGLHAYRLSISWPRVIPEGTGAVNQAGLDFYSRLVDALLEQDITPYITLYHWDLPYALHKRGGWLNREITDWFAEYARVMVDKLSDRVQNWMTFNEPSVFIGHGYDDGIHAPGLRYGWKDLTQMAHHVNLAHGKGVQAMRATAHQTLQIGFAATGLVTMPATDSDADLEAARQAMFAFPKRSVWNYNLWTDPILKGKYPDEMLSAFEGFMPEMKADDMATMNQSVDFFGMNIYQGVYVKAGENGKPEHVPLPTGFPVTLFHWPVTPQALYYGPKFIYERYGLPIYITENGLANPDWVTTDGQVHDPQRIDFTRRYLREFGKAGADGVDIRGYFHWSIMDNFEWAEGMKHRFGLIHVDYQTLKRTLKDSAHWYREVIASNGGNLSE